MTNLELVKNRLKETNASLVVMYENGKLKEYYNPRVIDIVTILKKNKSALRNAVVADKVIGKTAGSLLSFGGVKEIYAETISKIAIPVLEEHKIKYKYNKLVEYIKNNDKTGMCPMERMFKDEKDLNKIFSYFANKEN